MLAVVEVHFWQRSPEILSSLADGLMGTAPREKANTWTDIMASLKVCVAPEGPLDHPNSRLTKTTLVRHAVLPITPSASF